MRKATANQFGFLSASHKREAGGRTEASRPLGVTSMSNVAQMNRDIQTSATPRYVGTFRMSPEEWGKVFDNPRQRDTAARAKRARHLMVPQPVHAMVHMARLPDGRTYKLDGHTRSYVWTAGLVEPPEYVEAQVWDCATLTEAKELYDTFDSPNAVENATDRVYGALREMDVSFQSHALRDQMFSAAVRMAYELMFGQNAARAASTHQLLTYWLPELVLLDNCDPTKKRFRGSIMAAALLTFRRYGPAASPFWAAWQADAGTKIDGTMDAVQAYSERVERLAKENLLSGRKGYQTVARVTISAFEAYQREYVYVVGSSGVKATKDPSFQKWIAAAKNTKRTWG